MSERPEVVLKLYEAGLDALTLACKTHEASAAELLSAVLTMAKTMCVHICTSTEYQDSLSHNRRAVMAGLIYIMRACGAVVPEEDRIH